MTSEKEADQRIVYGARCTWWDSIDKIGHKGSEGGHSLPCCPHCGSMLFEMPNEQRWWRSVDNMELERPGYRKLVEWARGKCFPDFDTMKRAYAMDCPDIEKPAQADATSARIAKLRTDIAAADIIPEFGRYYVVEVSFKASNPIHRAIMSGWRGDNCCLFSVYDIGVRAVVFKLEELSFFRIVEEIPAMRDDYRNRFKLPKDVTP